MEDCKECGDCCHFINGIERDFCELKNRTAECYDFACDDYEE